MISPIFVIKVVFSILLLLRLTDKIISSAFFFTFLPTNNLSFENKLLFLYNSQHKRNKQTDKQNEKKNKLPDT